MKITLNLKTIGVVLLGTSAVVFLGLFLIIFYAQRSPIMGGDFTLIYRGQPWIFSHHSKPLTALYIGYAKCPDVCPLSLSVASQAFGKLKESELGKTQLLFLSVDQEHDLPNDVADYASQFFSGFIGLSGTAEQIKRTVNLVGASYMIEKNPKAYIGYSIIHSDRLFFLDRKGYVIDSISSPRSSEVIYDKIKELL